MNTVTLTPKNYIGWESIEQLLPSIESFNATNILVVTDHFLYESGLLEPVEKRLKSKQLTYKVYTKVEPEPPLALAEELVSYAKDYSFDLVIGFGGGSALDLAKLAAVMLKNEGKVEDYLNLTGERSLSERGVPKILIPTTAGTGSEVTNISVLSLTTTKDVIAHDFLMAEITIVDPEFTLSVPKKVTAATGIDALTHAIEAYVSKYSNPVTDGLALQAAKLIYQSIETAVKEGDNKKARETMCYGSHLAGIAFFNAGVAGVHALAYPLGGQFHISHGESNAVLLPYVMSYIRSSCENKLKDLLETFGYSVTDLSDSEAADLFIEKIQALVEAVEIPPHLRAFNILEEHLQPLTDDAVQQVRLLQRSPMPLKHEDIYAIYRSCFDGELLIK